MVSSKSEGIIRDLFATAEVEVNGLNPWDVQIHNPDFYDRVLRDTTLGLGESYMDGWWDCDAIDVMVTKLLLADIKSKVKGDWKLLLYGLRAKLLNMQSSVRAYQVGEQHYDLGNDLYEAMLDKRLNYTCGYWREAKTLEQAQEAMRVGKFCQICCGEIWCQRAGGDGVQRAGAIGHGTLQGTPGRIASAGLSRSARNL